MGLQQPSGSGPVAGGGVPGGGGGGGIIAGMFIGTFGGALGPSREGCQALALEFNLCPIGNGYGSIIGGAANVWPELAKPVGEQTARESGGPATGEKQGDSPELHVGLHAGAKGFNELPLGVANVFVSSDRSLPLALPLEARGEPDVVLTALASSKASDQRLARTGPCNGDCGSPREHSSRHLNIDGGLDEQRRGSHSPSSTSMNVFFTITPNSTANGDFGPSSGISSMGMSIIVMIKVQRDSVKEIQGVLRDEHRSTAHNTEIGRAHV